MTLDTFATTSTRPYLLRALYEWCSDNGLTPYLSVQVDETVKVPMEHVKNGEIVLNIGMDATSALTLDNEFVAFKARFSGAVRDILVPMNRVLAIYARENGQGMAFPVEPPAPVSSASIATSGPEGVSTAERPEATVLQLAAVEKNSDGLDPEPPRQGSSRPALKRIK